MKNNNLPLNDSSSNAIDKDNTFFTDNIVLDDSNGVEENIIKCKIDIHEKLEPPPVAMYVKSNNIDIALFTKGNFSIVTGPPKARKTFLLSMLMATAIKGQFSIFRSATRGVNLLFDTEQSRYKAQQITKRICNLSQSTDEVNFQVYSLRTLNPIERLELIEKVLIDTPNVNFVAIDGIIDLDTDLVLNAEQAQNIVSKLMQWTEMYQIHIVCVLHFNKSNSTLTGHLGTFSQRKADAVIQVSKSKDNDDITIVEALDTREKQFQPFAFSVDPNGLPYIMEDYALERSQKITKLKIEKKKALTPVSIEASIHLNIIENLFKTKKEYAYTELWQSIKIVGEKILSEPIGDNKAKDFVTYYIQDEFIVRVPLPKNKAIYTQKGQSELDV
jgi:hypothetical protein